MIHIICIKPAKEIEKLSIWLRTFDFHLKKKLMLKS